MTGLAFIRKDVIELIAKENLVYPEYSGIPAQMRQKIYAAVQIEEIVFNNLLVCESVKTYEAEIKLKVSIFGNPADDPQKLYEMADTMIIDKYARSGYSIKKVRIGNPSQNPKLGKMILEAEIILGARTSAV